MINAFKDMLNRWNDFNGKTDRPGYWWAELAMVIVGLVIGIIYAIVGVIAASFDSGAAAGIVIGLVTLIMVVISIFIAIAGLAMTVRRLRDAGFPWWFIFINFVPSIGQIALIVLLCFPSSDTPVIDFGGNSQPQSYTPPQPQSPAEPTAPVVDVAPEEAPVVAEETAEKWTCKCGQENTGKFCAACGSPKE